MIELKEIKELQKQIYEIITNDSDYRNYIRIEITKLGINIETDFYIDSKKLEKLNQLFKQEGIIRPENNKLRIMYSF